MALKGCLACMRYLVIITNLLLWLAGIAVLAVSVWLYIDSDQYLKFSDDKHMYHTALYILIGTGGVMTVVGFIGCCGALRESQCMLGIYFVLLLVIFAAEVTGGVYAYLRKDELKNAVTKYVNKMVREEYYTDKVAQKTIDAMQHDLHCCGAEGPHDWAYTTNQDGSGKGVIEAGVTRALGTYTVPRSCCNVEDNTLCDSFRNFAGAASVFKGVHNEGCVEKLKQYLEHHLVIVIAVAVAIAVVQILALIFSLVMCCGIRGTDVTYKA